MLAAIQALTTAAGAAGITQQLRSYLGGILSGYTAAEYSNVDGVQVADGNGTATDASIIEGQLAPATSSAGAQFDTSGSSTISLTSGATSENEINLSGIDVNLGPILEPGSNTPAPLTYTESQIFFSDEGNLLNGYIPGQGVGVFSKSGVTIGEGVDLGQQTVFSLENDGVDQATINQLIPYLGMHGTSAQAFLIENPLLLTLSQTDTLNTDVQSSYISSLVTKWNTTPNVIEPWNQLPNDTQAALAWLNYNGSLGPKAFADATQGQWLNVITELYTDANETPIIPTKNVVSAGQFILNNYISNGN